MIHLFDKSGCKKPCNFYPNRLLFVASETSKLLLDRFGLAVDIQGVLDQVPRYTGHVGRFPCEHIHVAPQKHDERVFLFGIKVGPDKGRFAGVAIDQLDHLVLL